MKRDNKVYITEDLPERNAKVDVVCNPTGNLDDENHEVYYNNFVVFRNGLFLDSQGNIIQNVIGWRYR